MEQIELFKRNKKVSGTRKIITTTNFNQTDILKNILTLHNKRRPVQLDATCNIGSCWKDLPGPELKSDILPLQGNSFQADTRNYPVKNNSLKSIFFDPPFLSDARGARMKERYTAFKNISQLVDMYYSSIKEFFRILSPRGILIIKCQDQSHDHKNEMLHVDIINMCRSTGFKIKDLFISINENFIKQWNLIKQESAKKTHCYFLVFKKPSPAYLFAGEGLFSIPCPACKTLIGNIRQSRQ